MKVAAVIPAFNEETNIVAVIREIHDVSKRSGIEITPVLINDCSTDKTAALAASLDCVLLDLPVNLGIGGAVQTGFIYAFEEKFDVAVQVDGDGQHPASLIPNLLIQMQQSESDVIIGSRFIEKGGFQSTFLRRTGIKWFSFLAGIFTGYRVKDSTSGFRMLNRKALAVVCTDYPDDYPEPEALLIYAKHKLIVTEFSVEMKERSGGVSSIGPFQAFYYMWKVTLGILFCFVRSKVTV